MHHRRSVVLFAMLALVGAAACPAMAGETMPAMTGATKATVAGATTPAAAGATPAATIGDAHAVPEELLALAGTYAGVWTMYGVDAQGAVVKRMAWTDTMQAANPQVEGDRAFLTTVDEMVFEGGAAPPYRVEGREGFFLDAEGRIGDGFIENFGSIVREIKLSDNAWSYVTPAAAGELGMLGFPAGAEGSHVLVKVLTHEAGVETHRISRLTTVRWTDATGAERWMQFVSLQGYHKRQS